MAAYTLPFLPIAGSTSHSGHAKRRESCFLLRLSSMYGTKLLIRVPNRVQFVPKFRCSTTATTTVSFSLPISKEMGASTDKLPRWSARAIKSFAMAELEARKLKYPNTGTEALLMGILVEAVY